MSNKTKNRPAYYLKSQGCHNCKKGIGDHCINCRRVDFDEIKRLRTPHVDLEEYADLIPDPNTTTPEAENTVSTLPIDEKTADALLQFIRFITEMPPWAFPLIQELLKGKTMPQIAKEQDLSRQTLWARYKRIAEESPILEKFIQTAKQTNRMKV